MTEEDALTLVVANDLSELERVGRALEAFSRRHHLSAGDVSAINLAADEILTNVILYAFDDREKHDIRVRASLDGGALSLVIEDDGRPFDPSALPAPRIDATLEERPVGGLGIHIARRLMHEMSYARRDGRNVLTLRRRLTADEPTTTSQLCAEPRIEEAEEQDTIVFVLAGRLDFNGAALLENGVRRRLDSGNERFLFDCGDLESLSSAGLRVLLIAAKESAAVALAAARPGIAETIEIAGLAGLLPCYETRAEALAALAAA